MVQGPDKSDRFGTGASLCRLALPAQPGVEESSSGEGATSERQRATLATNDFIQAQGDPAASNRRMVPKTYLS